MSKRPATYVDLANALESLPLLLLHERRVRGLSLRQAAKEAGVSFSTWSRWEAGAMGESIEHLAALLRWFVGEA